MRKLTDKVALVLLCCVTAGQTNAVTVGAFLLTLCATAAIQFFERKYCALIIGLGYLPLCLIFPEFLFFVPVLLYDIIAEKRWMLCTAFGVCYLLLAESGTIRQFGTLALVAGITVLLRRRTADLLQIEKKYIETRDSSAEVTMLLTEKNRHLRENQDYEIRLATLRERNRIAREIHDNVGHLLSRSILQTGALCTMSKDETVQEGLSSLSDTLNNAMTTIRKSVHDLHDESVDLRQALEEAVRPLPENGIILKSEFDCTQELPNKIKLCLISIVKEGVSNILRHSSADRASVILREHPAFYQLMVEDNGRCNGTTETDGIGLSNMRERIANLGGIIQINADENGFRIFITLKKDGDQK